MTKLDQNILNGFYGSETFTRHWLCRRLIWTEGVNYLVENGCAWLIDAIASYQNSKRLRTEDLQNMQFWTLKVDLANHSALLFCTDGNSKKHVITQKIEYTDCNLPEVVIWLERNGENGLTAMLPQER